MEKERLLWIHNHAKIRMQFCNLKRRMDLIQRKIMADIICKVDLSVCDQRNGLSAVNWERAMRPGPWNPLKGTEGKLGQYLSLG